MIRLIFTVCTILILTACRPPASDPNLPPATTQVQASLPSPTPNPTDTPQPTATPTDAPTSTPTPAPTTTPVPSPTPDLRVITEDPQAFLLTKADLPPEAAYYVPGSGWMSPTSNLEVTLNRGNEEGQEYLQSTGRLDGWVVYFLRGSDRVQAPELVYCNVIQFATVDGARLEVEEYNYAKRNPDAGWMYVTAAPQLGDVSVTMQKVEKQPNGEDKVFYFIELAYRNYEVRVAGYGWADEVQPEFVENVAQTLLARLESAPLSEP